MSDGATTWTARWDADIKARVAQELSDDLRWKIAHNWQFDMLRLEEAGVAVSGRIFDTMLAAHLLQPDLYKALGRSAPLYLDLRSWKHLSLDSPSYYNAADARITHDLFRKQWGYLVDTGMLELFTDTMMPATRVLMGMTKRGIRVDIAHLGAWHAELSREIEERTRQWQSNVGPINPFSAPQIHKLLYKEWGYPKQRTKYDAVTADEGAIKALIARGEGHIAELHLLLRLRELNKLRSTYAEHELGRDGCLHPHYLPASKDSDKVGAATGRLVSSPNIQNQPLIARRLFIPREGMVFLEADYNQIEIRIAAALSGDGKLQGVLGTGDIHAANMAQLNCDRVRAKNVLYGSLYGAGYKKLAANKRELRQLNRSAAPYNRN
jgi:DNA polymerase-1